MTGHGQWAAPVDITLVGHQRHAEAVTASPLLALAGTPVENHEEELVSILEFVDHTNSSAPATRTRPGEVAAETLPSLRQMPDVS